MNYEELARVLATALEQGRYEPDYLYRFPTQDAWELTNQAHLRDPQRAMVQEALQAHPDVAPLLGNRLNAGLNAAELTAAGLGDWLLTRTWQIGPQGATGELRAFVESPDCDVEEYLAFSGLKVDAMIALSPGADLLPIASVPESRLSISLTDPEWLHFGRDAKGHVRRKKVEVLASFGEPSRFHVDPRVATAALRVRRRVGPKVVPVPVLDTRSTEALRETLLVIAAATGTAMLPVASWVSAAPTTPLWSSSFGWESWSHTRAIRQLATAVGKEATIVAAVKAWEAFSAKPKLKVPLERLNRGLAASSVDCAIDIGIALEAILLSDLDSRDQYSLALGLRGAWLLGADSHERKDLVKQFNAIYTCRSTAVHHGRLPDKSYTVGSTRVPADEFMSSHAPSLAAKAVLKVIELGRVPDWGALVLGAGT